MDINYDYLRDRPHQAVPASARASIARELARVYTELGQVEDKPAPRFSLVRAIHEAATERGLCDGLEREVCGAAATLGGTPHDPRRPIVPMAALSTRDLTASSPSGGGVLVATAPSEPGDILRPWSVVAESGITVLPNLQGNVTIPRPTTAPTPTWLNSEAATINESQPVLGQTILTPKHVAVTLKFSIQLNRQAPALLELLYRQQLLGAIGQAIDTAFFAGTGNSGQPTGLHATAGIGTQSGSTLAHAGLLAMRKAALTAGAREDRLRWIGTPAVQETLAGRERVANGGRHLWDDGAILGRPAAATTTAPAGTLTLGDFSQAFMGVWGGGVELTVNPYGNDVTAFRTGVLSVRAVLTLDFAFPRPAAFTVATSVD